MQSRTHKGQYQPSLNLAMHIGELFKLPVEALFFFSGVNWYAEIPISAEE
jgi:DNA-binding XRE family transcriptional regulator